MSAAPAGSGRTASAAASACARRRRPRAARDATAWRRKASRIMSMGNDVEVLPIRLQDRMLLVAQDPGSDQLAPDPRDVEAPRGIHLHLSRHLEVEVVARGRVGERARLLVEPVECLRVVAPGIALADVGTVEQLQEVVSVRVVSDPALTPQLELARLRRLHVV